jgi:hypothetical protein
MCYERSSRGGAWQYRHGASSRDERGAFAREKHRRRVRETMTTGVSIGMRSHRFRDGRGASQLRCSTRGPAERATPDHVQMHVEHGLAGPGAAVHHGTIARVRQPFSRRDRFRGEHQSTEEFGISRIVQRRDVFLRNDENVRRRLGIDVPERQGMGVLVHDSSGNFPTHDAAEETGLGHGKWRKG